MKTRYRILALAVAFVLLFPPHGSAISIPDEKKLAEKFMEKIHSRRIILKDPVANHMVTTIGTNILAALPPQPFNYAFYIINDDRFNAFASPAANIFFNRGLICSLSSIDELAGIMGHEIAHSVSRHVSQSIDRAKLVNIGTLAGMLAGAIVGSTGGGSEAARALSVGSMAAGQSTMLSFTRDNETEADQKALLFLKKTCYSPKGLLGGLNKIRESDYQGIENIPDYFKTHPGTGKRIAHVSAILADYTPANPLPACAPTYDFSMVKHRLIGLYQDLDESVSLLNLKLAKDPDNPALNYGMGLLYIRKHRRKKAVEHLEKALSQRVFDPMILLDLGRVHIIDGRFGLAMDVLSDVLKDPVLGDQARYYTAVAQLESGNLPAAQENLTRVLEKLPETFPRAYYYMAKLKSRQGRDTLSHYFLGIYYSEIKDGKNARRHLKKALETLEDPKLKKEAQKRLEKAPKK